MYIMFISNLKQRHKIIEVRSVNKLLISTDKISASNIIGQSKKIALPRWRSSIITYQICHVFGVSSSAKRPPGASTAQFWFLYHIRSDEGFLSILRQALMEAHH